MNKKSKRGPDLFQPSFLSEEAGSPLFSGSAMKADDAQFAPKPESIQSALFGPAEFDDLAGTKESVIHCPFCDALVTPNNGVLRRHATDGTVLFGGVFDESERELGREPCMGSGLSVP